MVKQFTWQNGSHKQEGHAAFVVEPLKLAVAIPMDITRKMFAHFSVKITPLDVNETSFAILPPNFNRKCKMDDIIPEYSTSYPSSFLVAVPYLLAYLVYHSE